MVSELTICVACGEPLASSSSGKGGAPKEFCSEACRKAGRAFCKFCKKPLVQPTGKGSRRIYCDNRCLKASRRIGEVSTSLLESWNRSECIVCGKAITQTLRRRRKFCSDTCNKRYHRTGKTKQALMEDWGLYGPETRKVLREIQQDHGIGLAKRVALAIDREYKLR